MNHRLKPLLEEIHALERLVADKIQHTTDKWPFEIKDGKVVFEPEARRRHREQSQRLWQYLRESSLLVLATSPVIYALLIPIAMLDLFVTVFQWVCFPLYHVPHVCRGDYVVIDRQHLAYLNVIEKINCVYCGYSNGVLAFASEIASRTEQYWCPIKHARRVKGCHSRQCLFCEYGDADGFRKDFDDLRKNFADLE